MVKLILANQLATRGGELGNLEQRVTDLKAENQALNRQIAQHASLTVLEERALGLGMIGGSEYVDVLSPQVLASR